MSDTLKFVWADGTNIDLVLQDNPAAEYYRSCIKHLQHVDLEFGPRENPFHATHETHRSLSQKLIDSASAKGWVIEVEHLNDQQYLNHLHDLYVDNYTAHKEDADFLKLHDLIHLLEDKIRADEHQDIWVDYKERSGPLVRDFNREWLEYSTTTVRSGMCYLRWHELGKRPIQYYRDNEPADIDKLCSLAKPWLKVRPVLDIAITDFDNYNLYQHTDQDQFLAWFEPFREAWCQHWNIQNWHPKEMFAVIPVGQITDQKTLEHKFQSLDYPIRITL